MYKYLRFGFIFSLCLLIIIQFISCDLLNEVDTGGDDDNLVWIEWSNNGINPQIYYVSTTGSDESSGTGENSAFRTLAKAFRIVQTGGTIRVLPGTYNEAIGLINCGNLAAPITVTGYNDTPVLDGLDSETMGIFCEECTNMIFNNLIFQNYTDIGIGVSFCNTFTLQNLIVRENGHAVQLTEWELEGYGIHVEESENIVIENNDAYNNGPNPQIVPDYLMGTGINTYANRNVIIRDNLSHGNTGGGFLVEDSHNVLFEGNKAYENDCDASVDEWWDAGLWVDGGGDVIVRNNIFRDNLGAGIEISDEDLQNPTGYVLENNICTGNYFGIFIWNFGTTDWPDESVIKNINNQFTGNTQQDVWIENWY